MAATLSPQLPIEIEIAISQNSDHLKQCLKFPMQKHQLSSLRAPCDSIRLSTTQDMEFIHAWLEEEKTRDVSGNFLCNWDLTVLNHRRRDVIVYVDGITRNAVAYQWGGLIRPGIMQVREDMRGKGIGRKLVDRRIQEAVKRNECILEIQCKPSSSIPFWTAMGFILHESRRDGQYAHRILHSKNALPPGREANVTLKFYPEDKKWDATVRPCLIASPNAVVTTDGIVHLSERVIFFEDLLGERKDALVEIVMNGQQIFFDKAKRDSAFDLGIQRCRNGFYVDSLHPLET